ncbi:MAG: hypothetical protein JWP81_551 [Ferruginibacter sp.]|nr:hypothetical protein [Ferruginibacter sp.]
MKIVLLLLCIAFAGCGPKSNEEIAKDLITEKLKTTLPDFKEYDAVNFGPLGTAFIPYEETEQYINNSKALNAYKDSADSLEKIIKGGKNTPAEGQENKRRLQQLQDSVKIKSDRNNTEKQGYVPGKLFKMSHAYTVKDKAGLDKKTEDEFYFDKDLTRVVKVNKVY